MLEPIYALINPEWKHWCNINFLIFKEPPQELYTAKTSYLYEDGSLLNLRPNLDI